MKHWKVPSLKFSAMWDNKFPAEIVIAPLLCVKVFAIPRQWNTKWLSAKFFATVRQKKSTENCVISPLWTKLADTRNLWNLERFPYESFWYCDTNNIPTDNRFSNPLLRRIFRCSKFSETLKISPTKLFPTVRHEKFDKKTWYTPLMHKIFDAQKFLKHWRFHLRRFSPLRDQNCSTKTRDMPPAMHKFSWCPKLCETL